MRHRKNAERAHFHEFWGDYCTTPLGIIVLFADDCGAEILLVAAAVQFAAFLEEMEFVGRIEVPGFSYENSHSAWSDAR